MRRFVEEYHEKNEETYIFPVFRKAGKLTDLVDTLLAQHRTGRAVTARILALSQPDVFRSAGNRTIMVRACHSFIRIYRPHEVREDTVLFPALRTILKPKQVEDLGTRMEGRPSPKLPLWRGSWASTTSDNSLPKSERRSQTPL